MNLRYLSNIINLSYNRGYEGILITLFVATPATSATFAQKSQRDFPVKSL